MVRNGRFAAILFAIITMIAGVLGAVRGASAAPHPIDVTPTKPVEAPTSAPLRPHLPIDLNATPTPAAGGESIPHYGAGSASHRASLWREDKSLPKPPYMPSLSKFLMKTGAHTMGVRPAFQPMGVARLLGNRTAQSLTASMVRPMSADGGTIILTGDGTNLFENDITLPYGAQVWLMCENLPNGGNYEYVVWPANGSGPFVDTGHAPISGGAGSCSDYSTFNLSTPFTFSRPPNTVGSDSAYPGVWVAAIYNTATGKYVTETAIVANSTIHFQTYADPALNQPANDFNPGGYMVANVSGLNPTHYYAVGWVFTGGSGMSCDYALPPVGAKTGVCFTSGASGIQAYGGNLTQWWGPSSSPSSSTAKTGTYDIELYDATSNDMVSHQQISVEPSNVSWTLTPTSTAGATPKPGFNYNNVFAVDGLTDQSVTGLNVAASSLPATSNGHSITIAMSNPNGVVLTSNAGYPSMNAPPAATQGAGAISAAVPFPLDQTYQMAYGPPQNPFAPNVFTAQLYDKTSGAILASKSYQVLGYSANFTWNSGTTYTNAAPGAPGATETVNVTNTSAQSWGPWNGDGIDGIIVALPSGASASQKINLVSTTATDSAGNVWNFSSTGSAIVGVPATVGAAMPVGGTLSFQIGIQLPNGGTCSSTPCTYTTQIHPLHGLAYSAVDAVSNALLALASVTAPPTVVSTAQWAVQSEASTANMAARAPLFGQLMYVIGTAKAPSNDTYTINLQLNSVNPPGLAKIMDVKLSFPPAIDLNANPPTIVSPASGWKIVTNSTNTNLGGANNISLECQPSSINSCGVGVNVSQTFVLKFPLMQVTFPEQDIQMTGNWDGGKGSGSCSNCNAQSFAFGATSTTVNGIAGLTNINSMMLGSFSLNPLLMSAVFNPNTVATNIATSATLQFTNTTTSQDTNPDYVDQLDIIMPSASVNPTSITVPAGWTATNLGSNHWRIALCASPTNATPCSTSETANAIAPGGQLSVTLNYPSGPYPPAGTYNVTWYATGANGGEDTHLIATTTPLTFSTTTGSVQITKINGNAVPNGTEPQVGTDTSSLGNTYTFVVKNTGSTNIDTATITVPNTTRAGSGGSDSSGVYWTITSAPTVALSGTSTGTAGTCSGALGAAQYASATSGGNGKIQLSGCTLKPGDSATITVTMKAPYTIQQDYLFNTTVQSGATNLSATPVYASSNAVMIVLNGQLTIITPNAGWVNGGNPLVSATGSGATPATACVSCQVFTGSPMTVDFGVFSGTFNTTDIVDASVQSDAQNPNSWNLYVTTSPGTNPSNMLSTQVDSGHSTAAAGYTVNLTTMTLVSTSAPGNLLSTFSPTGGRHNPVDTIMNFQVATGGVTTSQAVTLTYTLVFN